MANFKFQKREKKSLALSSARYGKLTSDRTVAV